ncbi:MAG: hypothetical protein WC602_02900 [archaeon]
MPLCHKGQSSFELILVTAVVIFVAIGVLTIAAKENNITTALAIVKAQAINKLNEAPRNYLITKIDYKDNGTAICFNIITNRPVMETISFSDTVNDLVAATTYQGATIRLNTAC